VPGLAAPVARSAGFLIAGPVSGYLSDRFGPRPFATSGLLLSALAFAGLMLLPVDFPYWAFALIIFANGVGSGLFASPNTSAIMSSVPARDRGAASGMRGTFQNSGMSLSIGIFFALMIAGLLRGKQFYCDAPGRPGPVPAQPAARSPEVTGLPNGQLPAGRQAPEPDRLAASQPARGPAGQRSASQADAEL